MIQIHIIGYQQKLISFLEPGSSYAILYPLISKDNVPLVTEFLGTSCVSITMLNMQ